MPNFETFPFQEPRVQPSSGHAPQPFVHNMHTAYEESVVSAPVMPRCDIPDNIQGIIYSKCHIYNTSQHPRRHWRVTIPKGLLQSGCLLTYTQALTSAERRANSSDRLSSGPKYKCRPITGRSAGDSELPVGRCAIKLCGLIDG